MGKETYDRDGTAFGLTTNRSTDAGEGLAFARLSGRYFTMLMTD